MRSMALWSISRLANGNCQAAFVAMLDFGARGRSAAFEILPCRLHPSGRDRADRLVKQEAVCGLLFKVSAETVMPIAADPKRRGARVGMISALNPSGSALTHHPQTK